MDKSYSTPRILWLPDVEDHDYPAAESYLRLIYHDAKVAEMIASLRNAVIIDFKAKDLFRASQLPLLGVSNSHVDKDRKQISNGLSLSPLLLVWAATRWFIQPRSGSPDTTTLASHPLTC